MTRRVTWSFCSVFTSPWWCCQRLWCHRPPEESCHRDRVLPPPLIIRVMADATRVTHFVPRSDLDKIMQQQGVMRKDFTPPGFLTIEHGQKKHGNPVITWLLWWGQLYGSSDDMTLELCWIAPISDWMEINTEEKQVSCGPLKSQLPGSSGKHAWYVTWPW